MIDKNCGSNSHPAAQAFDQEFPTREKIRGTPSQMRFLETLAMRRSAEY